MRDKRVFIDSNILIYSVSDEGKKSIIAQNLLSSHRITISVQVLNEFCNVMIKKRILTLDELIKVIATFCQDFEVLPISETLVSQALLIKQCLNYSYWDSLIVATALASGVSTLYSEDMHHNQTIDGQLTIVNPFK